MIRRRRHRRTLANIARLERELGLVEHDPFAPGAVWYVDSNFRPQPYMYAAMRAKIDSPFETERINL